MLFKAFGITKGAARWEMEQTLRAGGNTDIIWIRLLDC